ncbi:hypothetical protein D3C78_1689900 [compost metagenome]
MNTTVYGSVFSTAVMLLSRPVSEAYGNSTLYALRNGWFLSIIRMKLNTTSSALKSRDGVKYSVVWNLTPLRSLKV